MIGVLTSTPERMVAEEFFQLFKTPWQFCQRGEDYPVIITTDEPDFSFSSRVWIVFSSRRLKFDEKVRVRTGPMQTGGSIRWEGREVPLYGKFVLCQPEDSGETLHVQERHGLGVRVRLRDKTILRLGYNLFQEVRFLIEHGQPECFAHIPTLELHIRWLRQWIVAEGLPVVEIPPVPRHHRFFACLTHDVDFLRLNQHKFDRTFWGFLLRSLFAAPGRVVRGQLSFLNLLKGWFQLWTLPLVYSGLKKDPWFRFEDYLKLEATTKSTFFLIPYKNRPGNDTLMERDEQRKTRYDITDLSETVAALINKGFEIGLHGIDAWHDPRAAVQERERISSVTRQPVAGIRVHWLYNHPRSAGILDRAGFLYNSTGGYNTTVGFRSGTTQVFRPLKSRRMLELPLHIHDMPLFAPGLLNLSFQKAREICSSLIGQAQQYGGVLTVLWHLRSLAPERFWGDFYKKLLEMLKENGARFGTAGQIVEWFHQRRKIRFRRVRFEKDRVVVFLDGIIPPPQAGFLLRITTRTSVRELPLLRNRRLEIRLDSTTG